MTRLLIPLLSLFLFACGSGDGGPADSSSGPDVVVDTVDSEEATFRVVRTVDSLEHPWSVDWLPDGRALIAERGGTLYLVDEGQRTALSNVPDVWAENQGGLLDVRVHPNYEDNGWIYMSYSTLEPADSTGGTAVGRARLDGTALTDVETIYQQTPFLAPNYHFGSRISFHEDGTMYVTLGERGQRREQTVDIPTPTTSVGTTVRLNMDGSVPEDNPFVGSEEGLDEVYTYGHRNQQGMAIHPETGAIWQTEHGPHGGDELNLIEAGNNYGWPAVSYGDTYETPHTPIGGATASGITDPVRFWDPSPAMSGMAFYTGDQFPDWQNDLFLGALAHQKILRVELNDNNEVTHQEELIRNEIGRIRDVAMGPDGSLYVLTDMPNGGLYRL
ncbi:MAG: PQQ-dependent sugar dehydrogenase, partial [Salinivenus sp.]